MSLRRKLWIGIFVGMPVVAIGMEIFAAVAPNPDRPTWTQLITSNVPADIFLPLLSMFIAWLGPHFVDTYRKRKAAK